MTIQHPFSSQRTDISIGHGLLNRNFLATLLKDFPNSRLAIIADQSLKDPYAKKISEELEAELIVIPNSKTRFAKEQVEDLLLQKGFRKDTVLIALGGGAITDLVGFIAATYMRGVPFISIPTTLLAMVDASIGGKNAIDTQYGKNLIGTVYFPHAIVIDLDTLSTLPLTEQLNGYAEILKIGLVYCPSLLENFHPRVPSIEPIVRQAASAKIEIVQADPFEKGIRRILNFGHTIGHALESISDHQLPHGQAIALGSLGAVFLSRHLHGLSSADFESILVLYRNTFPHLRLPTSYHRASLLQTMSRDKKSIQNEIRFVLIDRIGHAIEFNQAYCQDVSQQNIELALDWLEGFYA